MPGPQEPSPVPLTPVLRRFLYLTAMLTGAVVLVVEILGAKMLTPWFGSSHFVWTAQIAITLLALATGYYAGGWMADRSGHLSWVYGGLFVAAAWLCVSAMVCSPIAAACLELNLALGSIAASLAMFFVPLTLLAAVGPFFVRRMATGLQGVGRAVGRLSALGTVGSVAGVLLTSYVLVPHLRNLVSMVGTAGVLVAISTVYFLVWGRKGGGVGMAGIGLLLGALLGSAALRRGASKGMRDHVEVAYANSHFGEMRVIETRDGRRRYYLNDLLLQNTYDPQTRQSMSMFTYALCRLSQGYTPNLRRALCLGLGVGLAPRELAAQGVDVDVVEINPAVVPLAQRWFDFDPSAVRLHIDDARHFLRVAKPGYDTVQLDAFLGDASPGHLMTREAFAEIRRVLNPGGTLVINSFVHFDTGRDFLARSLHRTLASVFANVRVHAAPGGNVFYVASDHSPLEFKAPAVQPAVHPRCKGDLEVALSAPTEVNSAGALVLTDDYNPVDYFDANNRERIRRLLARGFESM